MLIRTRLAPPKSREVHVLRTSILSRMAAMEGSILIIRAVIGSGKTVLLQQVHDARKASGVRCAWISVAEPEPDGAVFVKYLCEAFLQLGATLDAVSIAGVWRSDRQMLDFGRVSDALQIAAASISEPTTLFIDDLHRVTDALATKCLNDILDAKSSQLHVVITTRKPVALQIQRRALAGDLGQIIGADLAFDRDETRALLRKVLNVAVSDKEIGWILEEFDGWATGMLIIALRMKEGGSLSAAEMKALKGGQIDAYFNEAVSSQISPEIWSFLEQTVHLRRFNIALCEQLCEGADVVTAITWLEQNALFLIEDDKRVGWYRFHRTFKDFLLKKFLGTDSSNEKMDLRKVVEWSLNNGQNQDAIEYLLDLKDYAYALRVIFERSRPADGLITDAVTFKRWINCIPDPFLNDYPMTLYFYGMSAATTRNGIGALHIAQRLESLIESRCVEDFDNADDVHTQLSTKCALLKITALCVVEDLPLARKLLDDLRRKNGPFVPADIPVLEMLDAYCAVVENWQDYALERSEEGFEFADLNGYFQGAMWNGFVGALSKLRSGQLDEARALVRQAQYIGRQRAAPDVEATLVPDIIFALADFLQGRWDESFVKLDGARDFIRFFGPGDLFIQAVKLDLTLQATRWPLSDVKEKILEYRKIAIVENNYRLLLSLAAFEIIGHAVNNDVAEATRLAKKYDLGGDTWFEAASISSSLVLADMYMAIAVLSYLEKNYDKAILIPGALESAGLANLKPEMTLVTMIKCLSLFAMGQYKRAVSEFLGASRISFEGRLLGPILLMQPKIQVMTADPVFRREFFFACPLPRKESPEGWLFLHFDRPQEKGKPTQVSVAGEEAAKIELTCRELEILKCVDQGMSNADLSSYLEISLSTTKWHLYNIYQKLGVRNRTAASRVFRGL